MLSNLNIFAGRCRFGFRLTLGGCQAMPDLASSIKPLLSRFKQACRNSEPARLLRRLKGKTLHWSLYLLLSGLVLGGVLHYQHYRYSHLYAVRIDGTEVGAVRQAAAIEEFLEDLTGKCSSLYRLKLYPEQEITLIREYRPDEVDSTEAVQEALRQRISFLTDAVMVTVDGAPVAPVSTAEEVKQVEEAVCLSFVCCDEHVELLEVELCEKISGRSCAVSPELVNTPAEIAFLLTRQKPEQEFLVASRGTIATRGGESRLDGRTGPQVHVKSVEQVTVEEEVPYTTSYKYSDKMYLGESRELSPGKNGLQMSTYRVVRENGVEQSRETVSSGIVAEPVARVVEKGTLRRFGWPVAGGGKITQRFHSGHRGIDIAAALNTPVLAADSGVVVVSSWGSSQGNYLVIRHNAYFTVYLHNSTNLVSVGQSVSRGQTIARLGSTGRSSGPHLHFEIRRRNGYHWGGWYTHPAINPLQFY